MGIQSIYDGVSPEALGTDVSRVRRVRVRAVASGVPPVHVPASKSEWSKREEALEVAGVTSADTSSSHR